MQKSSKKMTCDVFSQSVIKKEKFEVPEIFQINAAMKKMQMEGKDPREIIAERLGGPG